MDAWPELPMEAWKDTLATLHRYTQIIGKVRLELAPMTNHWWQVVLYVTARGLTTSPIPHGQGTFEIDFDFIDHELFFRTSDGLERVLALEARPVAEFYRDVMATLRSLGIEVSINDKPQEIADDITPFSEDRHHASYDPEYAHRWWLALVQADSILKEFRARFTGKCSPVHVFWGGFDLAVTRFSGRPAPERPGADAVTREAYGDEVISAGFWPGTEQLGGPAFYCYAAPEPQGFSSADIRPSTAWYDTGFKEYLLKYDDVRTAANPRQTVLDFCQSIYEAGANLGGWDRARLERPLIVPHPAARDTRGTTAPEQPAPAQ
ncbi:DUF5996 family protein [Vitiosangium sp. GDMCC 1.1324]|uniref:DUF5996 family protein n=1 Tax=Vitiosangium sp. (strain GDMCC 1.1324) TaxID=2138576 RepID=UPI000D3D5CE7|nr:DUF5996 family protein [Vitiosangium sp. GDMCC 1.1324]PTL84335.1 hypothetical protein DAT35_11985 [Vitiosangium sp. GDMCC 1.1324]